MQVRVMQVKKLKVAVAEPGRVDFRPLYRLSDLVN